MTQEPQKNNTVLIVIAIIGVIGTLVGAAINVMGNYNIEKLRQETELTRIALVYIATQGGATQMVLQSTVNAPTEPPYPTYTPYPISTTIPPTVTSIPIPTSDPRLFGDDFENGIRPEWNLQGNGFSLVNGLLVVGDDGSFMSGVVGDNSWHNYKIRFNSLHLGYASGFRVMLRVQNQENYMTVFCRQSISTSGASWLDCNWNKVIQGVETPIAGSDFRAPNDSVIEIEAQNDVYRVYGNFERKISLIDTQLSNGGIMIQALSNDGLSIDSIDIFSVP